MYLLRVEHLIDVEPSPSAFLESPARDVLLDGRVIDEVFDRTHTAKMIITEPKYWVEAD